MILTYCIKCEFHERVGIENKLYSKCGKENRLSIYSNCIKVTAIKKFILENDMANIKERSSALELCYPVV